MLKFAIHLSKVKKKKNPIHHDNTNQDKHTTGNNLVEKNNFND